MDLIIVGVGGLFVVGLILGAAWYLDRPPAGVEIPNSEFVFNVLPWNAVAMSIDGESLCVVLPWIDLSVAPEPIAGEVDFDRILFIDHVDGLLDDERILQHYPDVKTFRTTADLTATSGAFQWCVSDDGVDVQALDRTIAFAAPTGFDRVLAEPHPSVIVGGMTTDFRREDFANHEATVALSKLESVINFSGAVPAEAIRVQGFFEQFGIPIQTVALEHELFFLDAASIVLIENESAHGSESAYITAVNYLTVMEDFERAGEMIARAKADFADGGVFEFQEGIVSLLQSDPALAKEAFLRAVDAPAPFPQAFNSLASIAVFEEDFKKAEGYLDDAAVAMDSDEIVGQNRLRLAYIQGDDEKAEQILSEMEGLLPPLLLMMLKEQRQPPTTHVFPELARMASLWAGICMDAQDFEQAEVLFRKALALQPSSLEIVADYGVMLARQERDQEAIAWYEDHLEKLPGGVLLNFNLGNAQRRIGDVSAIDSFRKCVDLYEDWVEARIALAGSLAEFGEPEEARKEVMKLEGANVDPEILDALDEMIDRA